MSAVEEIPPPPHIPDVPMGDRVWALRHAIEHSLRELATLSDSDFADFRTIALAQFAGNDVLGTCARALISAETGRRWGARR